ncbi:unnamed protein product [Zymoseptoria tritici ST99CH_1A5]|uniref:BTB domain-containing protein n=1 Tax=Zymoseptoria tritici ST99CH_1A5 TaxID=1276529 RepID=A0A1Y6LW02_ZYMTR|nr:unnamed protein product [Zymoseptoria tritici ST99CH_1A5]
MESTVDIRGLWYDGMSADLLVLCEKKEYSCHKCIVLPRSKLLRAAAEHPRKKKKGKTVIEIHRKHAEGIEHMLWSMYESNPLVLFEDAKPEAIAGTFKLAVQEDLKALKEAARLAMLRLADGKNGTIDEVSILKVIAEMRGMGTKEMLEKADELEVKWMPKAMKNPISRKMLSQEAIDRYFASVEPRKKTKRPAEDGLEDPTPPPAYRPKSDPHEERFEWPEDVY